MDNRALKFVYIYARDPNTRDPDNPDGYISIDKLCNTKKYDDRYIKQDIQDFLSSPPRND